MEFFFWLQIVGAVVLGNAAFACIAIFVVYVARHEANGEDESTLPLWVYPLFIAPMLFLVVVLISLT